MYFMYVYFRGSKNSYMAALVCGCSVYNYDSNLYSIDSSFSDFVLDASCFLFFVCFFWGEFNSLFVVISITDSSGVILLLSFVMIRISNRIGSLSPPAIRVYFNLRMD